MRPLCAYSSVTEGAVIEWASAACARVSLSVNCRTQFIITDKLTHVDRQVESKPENDSSLGNSSIEYDAAQIPRHIIDFSYLELMSKWNYFLLLFLKNVMLEIKLQRTYSTIVQKQVPTTMVKWTLVLILLYFTTVYFFKWYVFKKEKVTEEENSRSGERWKLVNGHLWNQSKDRSFHRPWTLHHVDGDGATAVAVAVADWLRWPRIPRRRKTESCWGRTVSLLVVTGWQGSRNRLLSCFVRPRRFYKESNVLPVGIRSRAEN